MMMMSSSPSSSHFSGGGGFNSGGSMMMQHLTPQEQKQSMIQMIVKSQLQSDSELVVVFKDGFKVSRKALERLIGRVAVFPNTSYSGGGENAASSSLGDTNAYHLFTACTVVDRTTDTVLARIDNSENPVTLHM